MTISSTAILTERLFDSRRLFGANLFASVPGAVLQVAVAPPLAPGLAAAWHHGTRYATNRLGWDNTRTVSRLTSNGALCFLSAPLDGLLAATEIAEQVWLAAESFANTTGAPPPVGSAPTWITDDLISRLRVFVLHDRAPRLVRLADAARARPVAFTFDDEEVSLGAGTGSARWHRAHLPDPADVPWEALHDVPIVLVTGSNGKTTTVRLIAAIAADAARRVGMTNTDGVWVGHDMVAQGDYSGPAGARRVLREPTVDFAVLETARGGILRRGLATSRATAAVVTNVSADHLGEYGIESIADIADAKLTVARVLDGGGTLVVNADDLVLRERAQALPVRRTWFAVAADDKLVESVLAAGDQMVTTVDGRFLAIENTRATDYGLVTAAPLTLAGRARYNIANVLAAIGAARSTGLPDRAIARVLATFGASPADNPGRLHVVSVRGTTVVLDFVHNPDGFHQLYTAIDGLTPAGGRRILILGQAGDRTDDALCALADAALAGRPDCIVLKEMPSYLRGRALGDTSRLLRDALTARGFPATRLSDAADESTAVGMALDLAAPGDLVILPVHESYHEALRLVSQRAGG